VSGDGWLTMQPTTAGSNHLNFPIPACGAWLRTGRILAAERPHAPLGRSCWLGNGKHALPPPWCDLREAVSGDR